MKFVIFCLLAFVALSTAANVKEELVCGYCAPGDCCIQWMCQPCLSLNKVLIPEKKGCFDCEFGAGYCCRNNECVECHHH